MSRVVNPFESDAERIHFPPLDELFPPNLNRDEGPLTPNWLSEDEDEFFVDASIDGFKMHASPAPGPSKRPQTAHRAITNNPRGADQSQQSAMPSSPEGRRSSSRAGYGYAASPVTPVKSTGSQSPSLLDRSNWDFISAQQAEAEYLKYQRAMRGENPEEKRRLEQLEEECNRFFTTRPESPSMPTTPTKDSAQGHHRFVARSPGSLVEGDLSNLSPIHHVAGSPITNSMLLSGGNQGAKTMSRLAATSPFKPGFQAVKLSRQFESEVVHTPNEGPEEEAVPHLYKASSLTPPVTPKKPTLHPSELGLSPIPIVTMPIIPVTQAHEVSQTLNAAMTNHGKLRQDQAPVHPRQQPQPPHAAQPHVRNSHLLDSPHATLAEISAIEAALVPALELDKDEIAKGLGSKRTSSPTLGASPSLQTAQLRIQGPSHSTEHDKGTSNQVSARPQVPRVLHLSRVPADGDSNTIMPSEVKPPQKVLGLKRLGTQRVPTSKVRQDFEHGSLRHEKASSPHQSKPSESRTTSESSSAPARLSFDALAAQAELLVRTRHEIDGSEPRICQNKNAFNVTITPPEPQVDNHGQASAMPAPSVSDADHLAIPSVIPVFELQRSPIRSELSQNRRGYSPLRGASPKRQPNVASPRRLLQGQEDGSRSPARSGPAKSPVKFQPQPPTVASPLRRRAGSHNRTPKASPNKRGVGVLDVITEASSSIEEEAMNELMKAQARRLESLNASMTPDQAPAKSEPGVSSEVTNAPQSGTVPDATAFKDSADELDKTTSKSRTTESVCVPTAIDASDSNPKMAASGMSSSSSDHSSNSSLRTTPRSARRSLLRPDATQLDASSRTSPPKPNPTITLKQVLTLNSQLLSGPSAKPMPARDLRTEEAVNISSDRTTCTPSSAASTHCSNTSLDNSGKKMSEGVGGSPGGCIINGLTNLSLEEAVEAILAASVDSGGPAPIKHLKSPRDPMVERSEVLNSKSGASSASLPTRQLRVSGGANSALDSPIEHSCDLRSRAHRFPSLSCVTEWLNATDKSSTPPDSAAVQRTQSCGVLDLNCNGEGQGTGSYELRVDSKNAADTTDEVIAKPTLFDEVTSANRPHNNYEVERTLYLDEFEDDSTPHDDHQRPLVTDATNKDQDKQSRAMAIGPEAQGNASPSEESESSFHPVASRSLIQASVHWWRQNALLPTSPASDQSLQQPETESDTQPECGDDTSAEAGTIEKADKDQIENQSEEPTKRVVQDSTVDHQFTQTKVPAVVPKLNLSPILSRTNHADLSLDDNATNPPRDHTTDPAPPTVDQTPEEPEKKPKMVDEAVQTEDLFELQLINSVSDIPRDSGLIRTSFMLGSALGRTGTPTSDGGLDDGRLNMQSSMTRTSSPPAQLAITPAASSLRRLNHFEHTPEKGVSHQKRVHETTAASQRESHPPPESRAVRAYPFAVPRNEYDELRQQMGVIPSSSNSMTRREDDFSHTGASRSSSSKADATPGSQYLARFLARRAEASKMLDSTTKNSSKSIDVTHSVKIAPMNSFGSPKEADSTSSQGEANTTVASLDSTGRSPSRSMDRTPVMQQAGQAAQHLNTLGSDEAPLTSRAIYVAMAPEITAAHTQALAVLASVQRREFAAQPRPTSTSFSTIKLTPPTVERTLVSPVRRKPDSSVHTSSAFLSMSSLSPSRTQAQYISMQDSVGLLPHRPGLGFGGVLSGDALHLSPFERQARDESYPIAPASLNAVVAGHQHEITAHELLKFGHKGLDGARASNAGSSGTLSSKVQMLDSHEPSAHVLYWKSRVDQRIERTRRLFGEYQTQQSSVNSASSNAPALMPTWM